MNSKFITLPHRSPPTLDSWRSFVMEERESVEAPEASKCLCGCGRTVAGTFSIGCPDCGTDMSGEPKGEIKASVSGHLILLACRRHRKLLLSIPLNDAELSQMGALDPSWVD